MSWELCSFVVVVPMDVLVLRLSLAWACSSGQQHLQPGEAGRANSLSARHRAQLKLYQSPECFHLGSSIGAGTAAKPAKLGHGLSTHHATVMLSASGGSLGQPLGQAAGSSLGWLPWMQLQGWEHRQPHPSLTSPSSLS